MGGIYLTWEELMLKLGATLIPIIGTLVAGLVSIFIGWLRNKINTDKYGKYLDWTEEIVHNVVFDLQQSIVEDLKEASEDGRLTNEEAESIKSLAVEKIKNQIPSYIFEYLSKGFSDVDDMIGSYIEKTVYEMKRPQNE